MPAASAPLRRDERLFSYRERFHLLRRAFAQEVAAGSVAISVLERRLPAPNYTVNTLTALAGFCAQKPIVVIGGDQAEKLPRWHRAEELFAQYEFLVFARGGATPNIPGLRARYVPDFAEDISATEMRALLAAVPAASPMTKQAPVTRAADCASWLIDAHRPATHRLSRLCGTVMR